jgi:hypothetical protein
MAEVIVAEAGVGAVVAEATKTRARISSGNVSTQQKSNILRLFTPWTPWTV